MSETKTRNSIYIGKIPSTRAVTVARKLDGESVINLDVDVRQVPSDKRYKEVVVYGEGTKEQIRGTALYLLASKS